MPNDLSDLAIISWGAISELEGSNKADQNRLSCISDILFLNQ